MIVPVGHSTKKRRYWTPAELRKLIRLYPNNVNTQLAKWLRRTEPSIQQKAIKLGLHKSPAFMASPVCRFQRGMVPWNLGKTGYMGANATSFRKGNKPQTWKPVGSERVNRDATLERKVRNPGGWKPVKDILWQEAHGRIPRGRFVVHENRDRADFRLSNLVLVNRVENMRRNTYHRYPKEIARLIQLRGALNRQINKRAKREEQNRGSERPPVRDHRKGEGRRHAARPGQGRGRAGAGHHQQRQGGNRSPEGARQDARQRLHSGGRQASHPASTGARQKVALLRIASKETKPNV